MALAAICAQAALTESYKALYEGVPFDMPEVEMPQIPERTLHITDFGAKGDGMTDCTAAFAAAFDSLASLGGGRLVITDGLWLTGPITLENNTELHIWRGATVLFTSDTDAYATTDGGRTHFRAPINAAGKHDIAITGKGRIDGRGDAWRPVKRGKVSPTRWNRLTTAGAVNAKADIWYPTEDRMQAAEKGHGYPRPRLVSLEGCSRVLLKGVSFENSPMWNIHPLLCEDVIIDGITVRNPDYAQNGDGLDLESCRRVLVTDCTFDVGDDAICIKSGLNEAGRRRGVPTQQVIVRGCRVYHGHGGFVIGSEMSGSARDIYVSDCTFVGTDNGLRFKSTRGRGGVVERIYISDIRMTDITGDAITFDLYYGLKSEGEAREADETTPEFRDLHLSDITCTDSGRALWIRGLPEMPVSDVTLTRCRLRGDAPSGVSHARGITLTDSDVTAADGSSLDI